VEHSNKRYLFIALAAVLLQLAVFKALYPFGSYFTDSYAYVAAAANHDPVSFRPLGYSVFLSVVHRITSSETALVCLQYLLVMLGALYLFFTLLYFYRPGKTVRIALFVFLCFNPLLLYIGNYVSSDAVFISASLFWFVLLLWTINRPRLYQLLLHAVLLWLILQTRFVALYYPLAGIMAFVLSPQRWRNKAAGILVLVAVTFFCVRRIQQATEAFTGTRVFSAFSGWQLANNAMHVYCHVQHDTSGMPSAGCAALDARVRQYFDTACPRLLRQPAIATTAYMWDSNSPLKTFMGDYRRRKDRSGYFQAWHAVGPLYSTYGAWLIKKHPLSFARYYLWPSSKTYFLPPLEVLSAYNEGVDTVGSVATQWFNYSGPRVGCTCKQLQEPLLRPFPVLFLFSNIWFALTVLFFFTAVPRQHMPAHRARLAWLALFFCSINAGFNIFASPCVFRYQVFPMLLLVCFALLIGEWCVRPKRVPY
jgi:hypothetical protein